MLTESAYYPKVDVGFAHSKKGVSLPLRPRNIGPVLDPTSLQEPLPGFDPKAHEQIYTSEKHDDGTSKAPPQPEDFADPYLYPMLTSNERIRLTMLWYYTRDLNSDEEVLAKIQTKVDLLKALIGWEFAICGLLENDIYQRLATAGLPLAIVPRRESPCSHTVQQSPGSVFFIPDLTKDWRFTQSPLVAQGGLRAYAGAQLRCQIENGEDVALGALCVASNTPNEQLSSSQQDILAKFADMLTEDIINASRRKRAKQQEKNDDRLREAFVASLESPTDDAIMTVLDQVFPTAQIEILPVRNSFLHLGVDGPVLPAPSPQAEGTIWEDHNYIDEALRTSNHDKLKAVRPVRAIIARIRYKLSDRFLVVSTTDITHIFDDVDVRFVCNAAIILRSIAQEMSLQDASKAREHFMRGITHQLRTPIHGILGSVDLLADGLLSESQQGGLDRPTRNALIKSIRSSGRELMSTVNNVIKFNRWTESNNAVNETKLSDINKLESEILDDVSWLLPEGRLDQISVFFHNTIPLEVGIARLDMALMRDCLHSLVLNALQNTVQGSVAVTLSVPLDYSSIIFDVRDTGCGIPEAHQSRVFDAYEKGNTHSTGAGLGLTLAAKTARALDGTVTLVSSEIGRGSHFRVQFGNPGLACPRRRIRADYAVSRHGLPERFALIPSDPPSVLDEHFTAFLKARGLEETTEVQDALAVVSWTHISDQFNELLDKAARCSVAISLVPTGHDVSTIKELRPNILFFSGPFTSDRLDEILSETRDMYVSSRPLSPSAAQPMSTTADTSGMEALASAMPSLDTVALSPCSSCSRRSTLTRNALPQCLLVDDNVINLRIMRMYCDKRKYLYETALDGLEAIEKYRCAMADRPISLILLDLQMPKCDGIEACKQIRAIEAEENLKPAIIFIVTGQDSPSDKERSFAAGADQFFVKPLALKSLDRAIAQIFGKAQ